ncbi:uncharacterized protein LOC131254352 [Magnolia sinica]|uniref:uncharacterized protein LOC131254352 n=1 Tax=Magnolia sinica TaxID=86752 RepID=UPI00265A3D40|nr:uncharacterized protein LOC131254352 [Magnolia sinica]
MVVKWRKLTKGWVKINVSGSAMGNPSKSRGEGICRSDKGEFLFAFLEGYGVGSNVNAELRAFHDGLSLCLRRGLSRVIVESDSLPVVSVLKGDSIPGWKWGYWNSRIERLKICGQCEFVHIFKEGNALANASA